MQSEAFLHQETLRKSAQNAVENILSHVTEFVIPKLIYRERSPMIAHDMRHWRFIVSQE